MLIDCRLNRLVDRLVSQEGQKRSLQPGQIPLLAHGDAHDPWRFIDLEIQRRQFADEVLVERMTKQGRRSFDARAAVNRCMVVGEPDLPSGAGGVPCAIIDLVVRQVTPAVRPDDVLSGLRVVAGLEPPVPPRVTRLAQGTLTAQGEIVDPLEADREAVGIGGR